MAGKAKSSVSAKPVVKNLGFKVAIEKLDCVLYSLAKYQRMNNQPSETGYQTFPITKSSDLYCNVNALRGELVDKTLPDCGEAIWKAMLATANEDEDGYMGPLIAEFRLWLVYQRGRLTFGDGRREERPQSVYLEAASGD